MRAGQDRAEEMVLGSIEPMSPVDVARMRLGENPIWRHNRPGHWGRAKDAIYYGASLTSLLTAAGGIYATISLGAPTDDEMTVLSFVLCPIQCLATFALIHAFDFLRARRGSLEEIALTRLGMSDIAYGSFASATRASASFLVPILGAEIWMWFAVDWAAGLSAVILLPPLRWLLYCQAVSRSLKRLTSIQPVDGAFLVSLPLLCMTLAALGVFLGFSAIPATAYFLGPRVGLSGLLFSAAPFVAPLGYIIAIAWGMTTLTRGWHAATENMYRRLEM